MAKEVTWEHNLTKNKKCGIKGDSNISKLEDVIYLINKLIKEILKISPDFTGSIRLNFYQGKLASMNKSEKIKT